MTAASVLPAQGVTGAALRGRVLSAADSTPVGGAIVSLTNQRTGHVIRVNSRNDGRYALENVQAGGPYVLTARSLGFSEAQAEPLVLRLGELRSVDLYLGRLAQQLEAVAILQTPASAIGRDAAGGAGTAISDSLVSLLPTLNRNFTDFVRLSPQVTTQQFGGPSGGGVSSRFNNYQIDGSSENDLYGLSEGFGQPGGASGARSIALEAVKEYQVLLSPFDVRQGNFAGLLLNAVTKSGTDEFDGSAFYTFRNETFARNDPAVRSREFHVRQFGGGIGGPIARGRTHFYVAGEFVDRNQTASGSYLGQPPSVLPGVPVDEATLDRFGSLLEGYGIDAGSAGRIGNANPVSNLFGRVDVQLPEIDSRLVLRHSYGRAELDDFARWPGSFRLSSNAFQRLSTKQSSVLQLYSNFQRGSSNEFILAYNRIRDSRPTAVYSPQISVNVPAVGGGFTNIVAGSEEFSQGNRLDQDIIEVTNNFTIPVGSHSITLGTKNEFYWLFNEFARSSFGVYSFRSLDSLEAGNPNSYRVGYDLGGGIPADFSGAQYGVYAQDRWSVTPDFTLTYGLRVDLPVINERPTFVQSVYDTYRRRTDRLPSGRPQWSPRVGFNWTLPSDRQLRGGAGLFTGRPPMVFIGNAFTNSGAGLGILNCFGPGSAGPAPQFQPDPASQPQQCGNGAGVGAIGQVNTISSNVRYPQVFRASIGLDQPLPFGMTGTLEAMYTRGVHGLFFSQLNLAGPQGVDRHGRVFYGDTILPNGTVTSALISNDFGSGLIEASNQSRDYSYSVTAQVQKHFDAGLELLAAYTYGRSYDVQSATADISSGIWAYGRTISGRHDDRSAGVSAFDRPHRVVFSGSYAMPWDKYPTSLSFIFTGQSGMPFAYIYFGGPGNSGDLNGDGSATNDLIYVPRDARDPNEMRFAAQGDITAGQQAEAFERFIEGSSCLRKQRGRIMERNSCRSPFQTTMDLSIRQGIPTVAGQQLSIQLDIFNFLNLLNSDWGKIKLPTNAPTFPQVGLLSHVGQTPGPISESQTISTFNTGYREFTAVNDAYNFYQLQLSLRYSF